MISEKEIAFASSRTVPAPAIVLFFLFNIFTAVSLHAEEKLEIWTINPGTAFGALTDHYAELFSFSSETYELASTHFDNDYYKQYLRAAFQNHQTADIFHNWGENSLRPHIDSGNVFDLEDISDTLKKLFIPASLAPVTHNGKIYGIPYGGLSGVFFWYRRDIFERYRLRPPHTWEELIRVGETLKENNVIPIALANRYKWPGSFFFMYLVDRIGGSELFRKAYNRQDGCSFLDPAFIKAAEMIQDLVRRDFFPVGFNLIKDEPGNWNAHFISGEAGMYLMGSWFLATLDRLPPEMREKFDFFIFPTVKNGAGNAGNLVGSPGQDYLSISSNCRHKNGAVHFLEEYIASERYFTDLADKGFIPPLKENRKYLKDRNQIKIAYHFSKAESIQIYYDQFLPPAMAESHKALVHKLFELQMTPSEMATAHNTLIRSQ